MKLEKLCQQSHVLVVDDLSSTRALLRDMLLNMGFGRVTTARNGHDALRKINESGVDLIVSDQLMDGMTGTELLQTLRSTPERAQIPFIMLTSVRDAPIIDSALNLGVDDYLVKPVSVGLLQRRIEGVFRRRRALAVESQ